MTLPISCWCGLLVVAAATTCSFAASLKAERITPKQTVDEFFTSNWGRCEPLKNPLVLPEISDAATWEKCRSHIPLSPDQVEEAIPNLGRCMLKVIGWVRPNGNMNLTKYMDYLSRAGLDQNTLEQTQNAHKSCSQRALAENAADYKEQDRAYVECIFKHFDKICPPNFQAAVKQGYIVGITQISFVPRYDDEALGDTVSVNEEDENSSSDLIVDRSNRRYSQGGEDRIDTVPAKNPQEGDQNTTKLTFRNNDDEDKKE